MALTFTPVPDGDNVKGRFRTKLWDIQLDNNYITNGYSISGAQVGLRRIGGVDIQDVKGNILNGGSVLISFDVTNSKLVVEYPTGGGTVPAAIGQPAITAGATAVTSSAANGAVDITAGQAVQVAAGTDLSSITVRMEVIEY